MIKEIIYYLVVLLTFFYIIFKNRKSSVKILIILCYYSGLAAYYGKTVENPFKIILVILSIYIFIKNVNFSGLHRKESFLIIAFLLFSLSFLYSSFVNGDYFNLTFSQYAKYFTPICLFFVFNGILNENPVNFLSLKYLFFDLIVIQVVLSFVKLFTIGLQEYIVGSIAFMGGGPATILPVLGFILIWLETKGNLKMKDWLFVIMVIFIGFASLKRAIWFIMPPLILLFMYYIPKKIKANHLLYALSLVPIIFYAGVRLNPTLNKERKLGGSFDLQYVIDYSLQYSFGESTENYGVRTSTGRGGATFLLFGKLFNSQALTVNDYLGSGLREVYTTDYEEFNTKKFGVSDKGIVTGVFQSYIASGYIGVLLTSLLIVSVFNLINATRIRIVIAFILFWDYFFYSGLILRNQALFILLFFIIIYSNLQFGKKIYKPHFIKTAGQLSNKANVRNNGRTLFK